MQHCQVTGQVGREDISQPGQLVLTLLPVTTLIPQMSHGCWMRERKLSLVCTDRTRCGSVTASRIMGWDENRAKTGLVQDILPTGFATEL